MKTFFAIFFMIAGGAAFAGDPNQFTQFAFSNFAGHVVFGTVLFLTGLVLWIRGFLFD